VTVKLIVTLMPLAFFGLPFPFAAAILNCGQYPWGRSLAVRWGRGLFRLWLVGAIIWVALMAVVWWSPISSPGAYIAERNFAILRDTGEPKALESAEMPAVAEAKTRGLFKQVNIGRVPGHPWIRDVSVFLSVELSDAKISEAVDKVGAYLIARYEAESEANRWRNVGSATLSAFMPPLLMLAIGAALFWALRGFVEGGRRSNPRTLGSSERGPD
jgi:hypothetical protein